MLPRISVSPDRWVGGVGSVVEGGEDRFVGVGFGVMMVVAMVMVARDEIGRAHV